MGGTLRRASRIGFVVLLAGSCCSGIFHREWFGGFVGLLLILVLSGVTFRLARWYVRGWRLRLFGDEVIAVIASRRSHLDSDNDTVWEYTVSVTPRLGPPFTRSYGPHMAEPEPVGTRIRARYYAPTGGLDIGRRSLGSFVLSLITDIVCVAIMAGLVYLIGAIVWIMFSG